MLCFGTFQASSAHNAATNYIADLAAIIIHTHAQAYITSATIEVVTLLIQHSYDALR